MAAQPGNAASRRVVVFGSLNVDLVVGLARAPEIGETVVARTLETHFGGKGANQAVACARMGAAVSMVGCVGDDGHGASMRAALAQDDVDTRHVRTVPGASGTALILVDDSAQNRIAIVPGANAATGPVDSAQAAHLITQAAMVVLQLEVSMDAVMAVARLAHAAGIPVLLNPAPACQLPPEMWRCVDFLVLNESEAALLAGVQVDNKAAAFRAATALQAMGPHTVIVTLGAEGVVAVNGGSRFDLGAIPVTATDTTAAGDTFIGAFVAATVADESLLEAVRLGVEAAAICVTRSGARDSIPTRTELARSRQRGEDSTATR